MFQLREQSGREGEFNLSLTFCSMQVLPKLNDAHPHSVPVQMLFSSENTLRITPEIMFIWPFSVPINLTYKIKHHKCI